VTNPSDDEQKRNLNPLYKGGAEFQFNVNRYGLSFFEAYLERAAAVCSNSTDPALDGARAAVAALGAAVAAQDLTAKNTAVLTSAEAACEALGGGRVTFCKSGKDRTAMALTLEQTQLLGAHNFGGGQKLFEDSGERMRLTNLLRVGTRLSIAQKNIGKPKYSFNALQRRFMPKEYQAPVETIQDYVTSALNAES